MIYTSTKQLIKNELPNSVLKPIHNIFEDASTIYNELLNQKQELFKGNYVSEIRGRLLNFIIKRYFDEDMIPKTFPFEVSAVEMAFGQKRTELKRNDTILTLSKAQGPNTLPSYAKYKAKYSENNLSIGRQIRMDFVDREVKFVDAPYYGIITYNFKDNALTFLNIIFPDSRYKSVLDYIPLAPGLKMVSNEDNYNEEEEDRVLAKENIKKEAIDVVIKTLIERGN